MGSGASKGASKYLAEKHSQILTEIAGSHEFYFISAEWLLGFPAKDGDPPLPCHQELLKQGCLIKKNIVFYTLLKGCYEDIAMISHRWGTPAHPDPKNVQLEKIQVFLRDNPQITMIWFDYGSIPQGRRTEIHDKYFRECLAHISLLYLSLPVMIIFDKQYGSRFWCNLEMYLSLRTPSVEGIGPAGKKELDSRFHFYCVGSAKRHADDHKEVCMKDWKDLTASEAATVLSEDDIMVTNRRDKDEQLEKLTGLELRIKDIFGEKAAELEDMSKKRWEAVKLAKSGARRLRELKDKEEHLKKELEETQLEMARLEELMADMQDVDEEENAFQMLYTRPHATQVWSTGGAFLAKLNSGKVVAWGDVARGANLEKVQPMLDTDGLDKVWSTGFAFLAKLNSGKVVAWGDMRFGANLEKVQAMLDSDGLDKVWSTTGAFLAKLNSGKVVAWGGMYPKSANLEKVQAMLDTDGLDKVWSTERAFLAQLNSGKFVAWGDEADGANLAKVQSMLDTDGVE